MQAQGSTSAAPRADAPGNRLGILSFRQAIFATAEGKQALAELQSRFAPRQTELENLNKQIEDLRSRLRAGERTLSDDERNRLIRQGDHWTRTLQRQQTEVQEDGNAAQEEVAERIGGKMYEILRRYAQENGFSMIIDVSGQSTSVLFAAPQIDVTQDIIRLYDQANPVKAAAQAPAPAQPKPQAAPARPPQPQKPPEK
jgi:outer membrane protein